MKKLILSVLFIFILSTSAFSEGIVTIIPIDVGYPGTRAKVLEINWTADASLATIPVTVISAKTYGIAGWFLYSAETRPTGTAPTDNYDITLTIAGFDIAGGLLANRDEANIERVLIGMASHGFPVVSGDITLTISGNDVNSAKGNLTMIFVP